MCKSKMDTAAQEPISNHHRKPKPSQTTATASSIATTPRTPKSHLSFDRPSSSSTGSSYKLGTSGTLGTSSISSRTSLSSLRESLPENPNIYDFSEIRSSTNNFLAKRYSGSSSSTPSWRCTLRGKDVIVFQRKFRRRLETSELKENLGLICRSHHLSIIKLLGASISGDSIYLVYDFIRGGNLSDCLRNPRIPNFTALPTWMSRVQVATDLSHGLDYIHNNSGQNVNLVHKFIKSSSVIITEPSFNAKICHFGAEAICNGGYLISSKTKEFNEIEEEEDAKKSQSQTQSPQAALRKSGSRTIQFEGVTGYMSPEFRSTGIATQKSDVYSFGVVVLELLTGKEPVKYTFDVETRDYKLVSLIETARQMIEGGEGTTTEGRIRSWIDKRLNDSFPVVEAEKMLRLALECVSYDPNDRPDMNRVAGKISKIYLASRKWTDHMRIPTEITMSLGPR
ncbi:lysM domain receptor-like kinase 3 [Impatiens glandulifera]|uniref:lysM domain receptor-like kinase 3 n=1 Tax=Impatiens glandulifera TaxID=253017 RepID=UPI001FB16211|nr:lysM domain receptor-like kinase 3 [Impatiens glandulifera]